MSKKIIKPEKIYLQSYYEGCLETWGYLHDNYIIHNPESFETWKNNIFTDFEKKEKGVNLPPGFVPSETYWIIDNDIYVGTINIRPNLNDNLMRYGGHAGLCIRTTKRNCGYGTYAIEFILKRARKLKIKPLLLTCEETNKNSIILLEKFSPDACEKDTIWYKNANTAIRRYYYSL